MGDRKQEWLQEFEESQDLESCFFDNQSHFSMQTSKSNLRIPHQGQNPQSLGNSSQLPSRIATFTSNNTLLSRVGSFMTAFDKSARQTNTFITADDQSQISKV